MALKNHHSRRKISCDASLSRRNGGAGPVTSCFHDDVLGVPYRHMLIPVVYWYGCCAFVSVELVMVRGIWLLADPRFSIRENLVGQDKLFSS